MVWDSTFDPEHIMLSFRVQQIPYLISFPADSFRFAQVKLPFSRGQTKNNVKDSDANLSYTEIESNRDDMKVIPLSPIHSNFSDDRFCSIPNKVIEENTLPKFYQSRPDVINFCWIFFLLCYCSLFICDALPKRMRSFPVVINGKHWKLFQSWLRFVGTDDKYSEFVNQTFAICYLLFRSTKCSGIPSKWMEKKAIERRKTLSVFSKVFETVFCMPQNNLIITIVRYFFFTYFGIAIKSSVDIEVKNVF